MRRMATTLTLLLAGCGGGGSGVDDPFEGAPWTVEGPTVRIGSVDDPDYAFGFVRMIAVGPNGHAYSLHGNEASVRRWTPAGVPAGSVGRQGEGPGEFTGPRALGFFGDTLWVFDARAYRLSYFDSAGTFLGSVTPGVDLGSASDGPASPPRPDWPFRDGTFLARSPGWSDAIARGELTETPIVHIGAQGERLSHIWTQSWRPSDILALLRADGQGGTFTRQPFADAPLTVPLESGLLVVDRRAYTGEGDAAFRVTHIGAAGDTVWHRSLIYEPERLPAERVDRAVQEGAGSLHEFMSRGDPGLALGDVERRYREALYAPAYLPPVTNVVVAHDGSVWLALPEAPDDAAVGWWILDAEGEPAGRAVTPAGLTVHVITGDAIWGVETDELDVGYIVRYRLITET